jgi:hypothetical protein
MRLSNVVEKFKSKQTAELGALRKRKPRTLNQKPETRNPKQEKPKPRKPEPETRNQKTETQ